MIKHLSIILALAGLLVGCFGEPSQLSVPRNTAQTCQKHCESIGMRLSAVVIIMTSAGCVCEPSSAAPRSAGSAAAAAGAVIQAAYTSSQTTKR